MKTIQFCLFFLVTFYLQAQQPPRFIDVNGTSEVIVRADQIELTIRIKIVHHSITDSKNINDRYRAKLMQILKDYGINTDDIEVSRSPKVRTMNSNRMDGQ